MGERFKSESSMGSVGLGAVQLANLNIASIAAPPELSISVLEAEGECSNTFYTTGESVVNVIALVIYCPRHGKIALSVAKDKATWLPFVVAIPSSTWEESTQYGMQRIFNKQDAELDLMLSPHIPIQSTSCIHILRLQLPLTNRFVYRLTQLVVVESQASTGSSTDFQCCTDVNRIRWVKVSEAMQGRVDHLWGPEVAIFAAFAGNPLQPEIYEFGLDQVHYFVPNGDPSTPDEQMLAANGFGARHTEHVYGDYVEHCFPSFNMTFTSFLRYMCRVMPDLGLDANQSVAVQIFNAFNYIRNGYLSFYEFLLGIVAMEPNTPNNEARVRLIFRYYDQNQDGYLDGQELIALLSDARIDPSSCNGARLGLAQFHELVQNGPLAKCGTLCRLPFSGVGRISAHFTERLQRRATNRQVEHRKLNAGQDQRGQESLCQAHRQKAYQFGSHYVKLDTRGRCVEPRQLEAAELDHDIEQDDLGEEEHYINRYSMDFVFNTASIGHTFIDMLREFSDQGKGTEQKPSGFLCTGKLRDTFITYLNILVENVKSLLEVEPKLMKINSPAYVIGDLRGALDDLLLMERTLWPSLPVTSHSLVWLGNYAHLPGPWGVECILYLLALKINAPNKFFLMRGAAEVRDTEATNHAGLENECMGKYGSKYGPMIIQLLNSLFDLMPLAVIIDEGVLCVNNGLPITNTSVVEDIASLPNELKDPMLDPMAKDILTRNPKCTEEYVEHYLAHNNLDMLVRANQCPLADGYHVSANAKCVSLFSASNFGGMRNESAVVCVDHPEVRIVKLDTSKGPPPPSYPMSAVSSAISANRSKRSSSAF